MEKPDDFGTAADGFSVNDHCHLCFQGGGFMEPEITMQCMIDKRVATMARQGIMHEAQARSFMAEVVPKLKRCAWCRLSWRAPQPRQFDRRARAIGTHNAGPSRIQLERAGIDALVSRLRVIEMLATKNQMACGRLAMMAGHTAGVTEARAVDRDAIRRGTHAAHETVPA